MAQNAARSLAREHTEQSRPALRSVPAQEPNSTSQGTEVVAEILSDGTVRPVASHNGHATPKAWNEGSISGRSWILWWTRRSSSQA